MISIIVPVYKVEAYLSRCIESILAQTFNDYELILIDDGSPDNCGNICDEYAQKDNRIHVIHKKNGGLSEARNSGLDWSFNHSESEWITFIDSDDWVHPEYLDILYKAINDNKCKISACMIAQVEEFTTPTAEISDYICELHCTERFFRIKKVNAIVSTGKLYYKKLFERVRFPVGKLHEDEFTTYKCLFQTDVIAYINIPLYFYYLNPCSITHSIWSPSKLDQLEGIFGSIRFCDKTKRKKVVVFQIRTLLSCAIDQYTIIVDKMIHNQNIYLARVRYYLRKGLFMGLKYRIDFFSKETIFSEVAFSRGITRRLYLFLYDLRVKKNMD